MGLYNLNRIFQPGRIAVIGASEKRGTIGSALVKNLIEGKFEHPVIPVNPNYHTIHGIEAVQSVYDLDTDIDLAVIATPIATVPDIVEECVKKKMGGAVIISAGGKETGEHGKEIERKIREIAYSGKLRIIGPNCLGIIRTGGKMNASFASEMPASGNLAFVSQSGAICTAILDRAFQENIGFSHFVSIGSMLDVDFGDMIDYLGNKSAAKSILLYIESLTNFRKFMSAARAVSRIKPIIVLKSGRSPAGARAAASHTGAMAGEDVVYDAAFKRAGVVRVDTIEELFDCAELTAKQPRPSGSRLAIITNGGGPGVMATDTLAMYGSEPAPLDPETVKKLDAVLPPFWSRSNPIDILGDAGPERFRQVLNICYESKGFDGLLVILAPQALANPISLSGTLAETMKGKRYPVFTCCMGGRGMAAAVDILNASGIPTYETPERAIRAFLYMHAFTKNQQSALEIPPRLSKNMTFDKETVRNILAENKEHQKDFLSESDAKTILTAYGLPVIRTETADTEASAVALAGDIGYPLVMKLHSPDITHKTDAGGVKLDLREDADVREAFRQIMESARNFKPDARLTGVTIQPYMTNPDYEILLGAKRDPNFGPVILFGMGGIFTEILKDRAIGLPPMNRLLANRLIRETRTYSLLQGYRNRPPADIEQIEEMIIRLSQLLVDFPVISELDMNPVLIKSGKATAVDARILISPSDKPSPLHLVISPYPEEHEDHVVTNEGVNLYIRPVKPEDGPLFLDFFDILSPRSIYYRFFTPVKELNPAMLARFTQIDYDREIALVGMEESSEEERIIGVSRIVGDPDGKNGEFAVIVGDSWQGRGIGACLLERCLHIAQRHGFQKVSGSVLRENKGMLALGKKLGFNMKKDPDIGEVELEIGFNSVDLS